ncbi:MAG: hypothetical protein CMJ58_04650 [Planctomycetaceae bacterium]|nr:hypothetical protein [Planctomycetaceae bacterium]
MFAIRFSLKRLLAWTTVATAALGIWQWQRWPLTAVAMLVLMVGAAEYDRLRRRTGPALLTATALAIAYWCLFGPVSR